MLYMKQGAAILQNYFLPHFHAKNEGMHWQRHMIEQCMRACIVLSCLCIL